MFQAREFQRKTKKPTELPENPVYIKILLFIFTFITLIFSVVILYGYLNIAQQNRIINTLNSEIRSLETERDDNNMKLEPYKSVDRIAKLARLNYNMDFPKKEQVKYLDKID